MRQKYAMQRYTEEYQIQIYNKHRIWHRYIKIRFKNNLYKSDIILNNNLHHVHSGLFLLQSE